MWKRCHLPMLRGLFLIVGIACVGAFLPPAPLSFAPLKNPYVGFCVQHCTLPPSSLPVSYVVSSSSLQMGPDGEKSVTDVDGMQTAPYIMAFMLFVCLWNFTIPVEFRRARICSEQQVLENPSSKCMTFGNYVSGIVQYYQDGGTFWKFDFSIDRDDNIWITGPQEILE